MPTRENAILDQILANDILATCSQEPTTDPPIGDSDHNCVIWEERPTSKTGNETHKKQVPPGPDMLCR
ncbi:Hypp9748 [Branchiostoma lanceolatum]|uniref:Hypp9748 protein n=1 Tax=Branchiostoma lanceolatum TaxID=7740 RepID=A0A8S4MP03_BRALA|nr:Hypp9748 [Branchiostoma lanceolatum]